MRERNDCINHEVAKDGEAIQRPLSGDIFKSLDMNGNIVRHARIKRK